MRVPGFADARPQARDVPATDHQVISRRSGSRQVNLRLLLPLHRRYRVLIRDCESEGIDTSLTEIIHALLHHHGPADPVAVRDLVRAWRRVLDDL